MPLLEFGTATGLAYRHDWKSDISNLYKEEEMVQKSRLIAEERIKRLTDDIEFGKGTTDFYRGKLNEYNTKTLADMAKMAHENPDLTYNLEKWTKYQALKKSLKENEWTIKSDFAQKQYEAMSKYGLETDDAMYDDTPGGYQEQVKSWEYFNKNGYVMNGDQKADFVFMNPGSDMNMNKYVNDILATGQRNLTQRNMGNGLLEVTGRLTEGAAQEKYSELVGNKKVMNWYAKKFENLQKADPEGSKKYGGSLDMYVREQVENWEIQETKAVDSPGYGAINSAYARGQFSNRDAIPWEPFKAAVIADKAKNALSNVALELNDASNPDFNITASSTDGNQNGIRSLLGVRDDDELGRPQINSTVELLLDNFGPTSPAGKRKTVVLGATSASLDSKVNYYRQYKLGASDADMEEVRKLGRLKGYYTGLGKDPSLQADYLEQYNKVYKDIYYTGGKAFIKLDDFQAKTGFDNEADPENKFFTVTWELGQDNKQDIGGIPKSVVTNPKALSRGWKAFIDDVNGVKTVKIEIPFIKTIDTKANSSNSQTYGNAFVKDNTTLESEVASDYAVYRNGGNPNSSSGSSSSGSSSSGTPTLPDGLTQEDINSLKELVRTKGAGWQQVKADLETWGITIN